MTNLGNISASDLRRAAAIREKIDILYRQLDACLGTEHGNGLAPARTAPAHRQSKGKAKGGKVTVADAILQSLGPDTLPIKKIIIRASQIRGKAISKGLLSFTLAQMRRRGR